MGNVYNWYVVARFAYTHKLTLVAKSITYLIRLIFGCYIPHTAVIGKGTKFGYGGIGTVIHGRSIIGENCIIDQCVTLGGTSHKYEVPKLGSHVYVGAGAKIIGSVNIGNNVVIGANSVVIKDVPDNSVAVGIPARIVKTDINIRDYM